MPVGGPVQMAGTALMLLLMEWGLGLVFRDANAHLD